MDTTRTIAEINNNPRTGKFGTSRFQILGKGKEYKEQAERTIDKTGVRKHGVFIWGHVLRHWPKGQKSYFTPTISRTRRLSSHAHSWLQILFCFLFYFYLCYNQGCFPLLIGSAKIQRTFFNSELQGTPSFPSLVFPFILVLYHISFRYYFGASHCVLLI